MKPNWQSDRLSALPPYLFVEIDVRKRQALEAGRDVIDFGVGDPDLPTHAFIVDAALGAIPDASNHRYCSTLGMIAFRESIVRFMQKRYGVDLDARTQVLSLLGAKEGIGHLPIAVLNPGDVVLVPEPGYPVYDSGTIFAGGRCEVMPLHERNGWLPRLDEVPPEVARAAKIMWLNYPNNPTGATAPIAFFREAVAFAREYGILIAQDAAYSELYYGDPPPSILQVEGAVGLAVEFHSLSKTFNMTGWRIAFVVGNAGVLSSLAKVKSNLDSGIFQAVQHAGVAALDGYDRTELRRQVMTYKRRRDVVVSGLRSAGWEVAEPSASIYVWAKCPSGVDSITTAQRIFDETAVVAIPGIGFGKCAEGFLRFALTVPEERAAEAMKRIAAVGF